MDRFKKSQPSIFLGQEKEMKGVKKLSESASMDKPLKIAQTLKKLIKDRDLTLKEVSSLTGIPASTIQHIVNGRSVKDVSTLIKIAEGFEVSLNFLLYGKDETPQEFKMSPEDLFSGVFEIVVRKHQSK
jgi:predicted transcriptional regulator